MLPRMLKHLRRGMSGVFSKKRNSPPAVKVDDTPSRRARTFFVELEYSLIGPMLIRPNKDPVRVPAHIMEPGDRIYLQVERESDVIIVTRRKVEAGKVLKGTFLITNAEWQNFMSRKSHWKEITGLKKLMRIPAEEVEK